MWGFVVLGLLAASAVRGSVIVFTSDIPHAIMEEFRDLPASFGPDLPPDGLRGLLVEANPPDGCTEIDKPPADESFSGKWIALIARYNCSFEIKVRNAQAAGYDCVIVHNVNSTELENMSAKNDTGIDIPAVFVNDPAGRSLSTNYLYMSGFYIMVNGDLPFNINTHLLLPFAIVVLLCLLVILIFMVVKCIKDRRRARRHRLPGRTLAKIPTCKFNKGDPYDTCAICLDDYQEGEKLRVLPCAHAYHSSCIDPWLTQNKRVCPVCKRKVFAAGERARPLSDSDSDTEPLLRPATPPTQGGTFEDQRENPFSAASRFMARLRARHEAANNGQAARSRPEEGNQSTDAPEQNSERRPLVRPAVSAVSERRGRRARRTRSADPRHARTAPQPDTHSINGNEQGEIGVAALPAPRQTNEERHVNL